MRKLGIIIMLGMVALALSACGDKASPGLLHLTDGTTIKCDRVAIVRYNSSPSEVYCDGTSYPYTVIKGVELTG